MKEELSVWRDFKKCMKEKYGLFISIYSTVISLIFDFSLGLISLSSLDVSKMLVSAVLRFVTLECVIFATWEYTKYAQSSGQKFIKRAFAAIVILLVLSGILLLVYWIFGKNIYWSSFVISLVIILLTFLWVCYLKWFSRKTKETPKK